MTMENSVPSHVGIIMDGNGRWAEARRLPRIEGHRRGAERALEVIRTAAGMGIKALTLYTFSLENWQRPLDEVSLLMKILESYLRKHISTLMKEDVRFRAIGDQGRLPHNIRSLIREAEEKTSANSRMTLAAALSYGGRDEIVRAARRAVASGARPEDISEESFAALLDTAGLPPVDLVIRTSGEMRISNFLLWQSAYSELYFTDIHWPDFTASEFARAVDAYRTRERRFGAVAAKKG